MKATYQNSYPKRSKNGNVVDVFVYEVSGTKDELEAFKDAQGSSYRETPTGVPLFFTLNYVSDEVSLVFTSNGNVVVDNSELRKAASLAKQYGFLGNAIADRMVTGLLGNKSVGNTAQSTPTEVPTQSIDPFTI